MLFSCSCLLLWSSIITIFYFNEVYILARRVYSLYVSLMAIFRSNWQMQIASGLQQDRSLSAGLLTGLVEAIGVKSCWLHVPVRPDFVEPSVFHFQYL